MHTCTADVVAARCARRDRATRRIVRIAGVLSLALAATPLAACGGSYEVLRVHDGQRRVERYVSPDAYTASLEASLAERRGDFAASAEWLRKARDEDPDAPELQARYGLALCRLGKREAAMFAFGDALRIAPDLELAYTARAQCRLLGPRDATALAEARGDLERAVQADSTALEPALMLVDLDVAAGALPRARARLEELAIAYPSSAPVLGALSEVAARQGDVGRAVEAARLAAVFDPEEGARARARVLPIADASGVARYGLVARGRVVSASADGADATTLDAPCSALSARFDAVARRGEPSEIALAADAVRARCPELEGELTLEEARAIWSPARAEALEARALASLSPAARRWARRMQLRRVASTRLLDAGALPAAEDRESLALHVVVAALRRVRVNARDPEVTKLVEAARVLAPAEPTVARLAGETARELGRPSDDAWRAWALALARTDVERAEAAAP
jgi:Tfp pilus assembly protein PilF